MLIQQEFRLNMRKITTFLSLSLFSAFAIAEMDHHAMMMKHHGHAAGTDERQLVEFPAPAYHATLKSMRDHLRAINQIQGFLAEENYEAAADAAEKGLGQGHQHGEHGNHAAHFMPAEMRQLGASMHKAANDLSLSLRNVAISNDLKAVFTQLHRVTNACVACHDQFRLAPLTH
jgi:cytochrome c556